MDPEELPEDEDEFYDHQLIDLDVVLADGTEIGRITEISHLPSQDLFIVERPDGSEVMIPFVEEIVTEIDLEEQRAVITPPPGLIDESEAVVASSRDEETGDASGTTAGLRGCGRGAEGRRLMRLDVVTIFPEYLDPLNVSLVGKARARGCSTSTSTTCGSGRTTGTTRSTTPPTVAAPAWS
ncbi:Ribosome maturation factor RimM [Streptomyces cyaneofuscatus]